MTEKSKNIGAKGVTDYILWLIVLLILMLLVFAVLYFVGIQQIQDFLKQNLIK